jgi:cytochrome c oxidase subunit 4
VTDETTDTTDTATGTAVATRDDAELRELAHHPEQLPMLPGELKPHPTPREYVIIAVVLVILTALEVGASYLEGDVNDGLLIALLVGMAALKFYLVVMWYMHLRTDLRIFRRMFVVGLLLATAVYLVALTSLHLFGEGGGVT